jgi:hypothetical protein
MLREERLFMSVEKKVIAKHILENVGGNPKVLRFHDANNISAIDLYIGSDRPYEGVTTYSTIGLSDTSIEMELDDGRELRAELIGACGSNFELFSNIISSCAFNVINDNFSCQPGMVYPNVVKEYYEDTEMKHILLTTPFLWEGLSNIETEKALIAWLLAVPISEAELQYLNENGSDALEEEFEKKDIDIFDIYRGSVF